ncbi:MAG: spermidine synthase, partial [Acidobacteria bacterium]
MRSSGLARGCLLVLVSGFCALVYQVSWLRLLQLVFGHSTAATAAVLAIFMGGLGAGGLLLGRRADASANPLGLYARLEAGIALLAALSPFLVDLAYRLYVGAGGSARLGLGGATLLRLLLAALVLG